jgi:hypothetical protein
MTDEPEVTDDIQFAIYVQLSRILDALYISLGPTEGKRLSEIHASGKLVGPDPYLVEEEIDDAP